MEQTRNALDLFNGTRDRANAGYDNSVSFEVGFVQSVDARAMSASVYLPQRNITLTDIPIVCGYMSDFTGNLFLPQINSSVFVARSKFLKPFIISSVGNVMSDNVKSDIQQNEQLLSTSANSMIKQGAAGEQTFLSGFFGVISQEQGETSISDASISIQTSNHTVHDTSVAGEPFKYESYTGTVDPFSSYSDASFISSSTGLISESLQARVITDAEDTIVALTALLSNVQSISDLICNQDISSSTTQEQIFDMFDSAFLPFLFSKTDQEIIIQTGSAVGSAIESKKDIAGLEESDLEYDSLGAKTIYKIGVKTQAGIDEKFGVTDFGARIREGNIVDRKKSTT